MALMDKLSDLAATATSKANSAIESGKLNLKINNEEKKINEYTLHIGELLVERLDAGETFDDEIAALYSSIQAAREVIAGARAELDANRQKEDTGEVRAPSFCPSCGATLSSSARFCDQCGSKIESAEAPKMDLRDGVEAVKSKIEEAAAEVKEAAEEVVEKIEETVDGE